MQVGEHAQPVVRAFLVRQVQAEQLLLALDVQPEQGVDGLADVASVFPDLVVNGIEPDDG